MIDQLREALLAFIRVFNGLPIGKRIALSAVGVFMIVGILLTAYLSGGDNYTLLYSNLSQEDTLAVTEKLKERLVPFRLDNGGKVIMVSTKNIYQLRLELAGEGIPSGGGIGFELFDQSTFGMTEFIQNLNFRRALQGELQRTINSIGIVKSSRVHIVIPKDSFFEEDRKKTTASVVLELRGNRRPSDEQIQSILNLVASSVEGLDPNSITVVDHKGNLLSFPEEDNDVHRLTVKQMEYKSAIENNLESRIRTMIERISGKGKVVVRVSAKVNFRQTQQTEEIYDPNSQVARSEQRLEEKSTGASMPSGIAGVQSNLPAEAQAEAALSRPATASKVNETVNYEINKTVKTIMEPTSELEKLSVAVLVDGKYTETQNSDGAMVRTFQPLGDEERARIDSLVRSAIGFDPARQDKVTIESMQFDTSDIMGEIGTMGTMAEGDFIISMVKYAGVGILGIVIFLMVVRPIMGWVSGSTAEVEELKTFPKTLAKMEEELENLIIKEESAVPFKERVSQLVAENPEAAANLVRAWLKTRG
ncbi:MAG: flagellar basal-body MS-ring/collar protein FliF [Nitrospinota bacterium]|nr:flagellar basal-body MS-ring/collar protein FliF [Nitrospinota bacterium]